MQGSSSAGTACVLKGVLTAPPHLDSSGARRARACTNREWSAPQGGVPRLFSPRRIILVRLFLQQFAQLRYRVLKTAGHAGAYISAMAANPRRVQIHGTRLAAKIFVQQAKQQMILPHPVNAKIAPRQA